MSFLGKVTKIVSKSAAQKGAKLFKSSPAPEIAAAVADKIDSPVSDCFSAGFSITDVMPEDIKAKKYWVAGYKTNNPATGVLNPMTASAVWIDDKSGRGGVVFASIDDVGMTSHDVDIIKDSLKDFMSKTGCRTITIVSTHNHAGIDTMGLWGALPKTGRNEEFLTIVREGVKKVVEQAYEDRRDGDLFYGTKETPDIQRDSRDPQVFSKVLARLRFVPHDGTNEIWLLNYASHSESLLGQNSLVSADFPHFIREKIAAETGARVCYTVGAIGGLIRLKELDEDNVKSTIMGGHAIADTAIAIDNDRKLAPKINMIKQEFYADADNFVLVLASKVGIIKAKRFATGKGTLNLSLKTEMTFFDIDGLKMLMMPGEIFPELVYGGYLSAEQAATKKGPEFNPQPLTEIVGDKDLLIFGLANDEIGYIVTPNDYYLHPEEPFITGAKDPEGGKHYEETNGLGPNTAFKIAEVFTEMIKTFNA